MNRDTLDRILDLVGTAAVGVLGVAGAGVAMPAWLTIGAAVIAFAAGKASRPGVPFRGQPAASKSTEP